MNTDLNIEKQINKDIYYYCVSIITITLGNLELYPNS